ncbi:MAG: GNAT family N-acetyltransferase [Rhodobacterales bacterium]|nr:MAG: GNAT family N-acetyltransferase [Rhodobacterales bacterium]
MSVTADALTAALQATWPAASTRQVGPVTIREGKGGGARVSAATAPDAMSHDALVAAEDAMRALGQVPIWQVTPGPLDDQLAQAGYAIRDRTVFMTAPVDDVAAMELKLMSAFRTFPPIAVQRDIWAEGGIGPERLAVMDRACSPKISLLGRVEDRPMGAAFAAIHDGIAMIHAVEVLDQARGKGLGRNLMIGAARWAQEQGAQTLALLVTEANPARRLYERMGFETRPGYHYRLRQEETS